MGLCVPVTNGALADFTLQLKQETSRQQINAIFKKATVNEYNIITDYTEDPLVSADIKGNTHSCVIDGILTSMMASQVKLIAWFDNEYEYTSRMMDWLNYWKKIVFI